MRTTGSPASARAVGGHDHVCWSYDDIADFRVRALGFLLDGHDRGQQLRYIGAAAGPQLEADVRRTPGFDDLLDRDALRLWSLEDTYGCDRVIDPFDQVAAYAAATQRALDEGYTGLRVVAEATELVRTVEQREAFTRYEHLIDRFMTSRPFAAMCGYDRGELGSAAVAEVACLHPVIRDGDAPFQLCAAAGGAIGLAGEVDHAGGALFSRTLQRAAPAGEGGCLIVDATSLDFIDHHGVMALDELAAACGKTVELRGAPTVVGRVIELLDLHHVRAAP